MIPSVGHRKARPCSKSGQPRKKENALSYKIFIHWGFTGTLRGMTNPQHEKVQEIVRRVRPGRVHHGMAPGADTQFHRLAVDLQIPICGHPADQTKLFLFNTYEFSHIYPPYPPLVRNHHIVDEVSVLIAAPHQANEVLRSGTWATVRYARKECVTTILVSPDGQHNTFHYIDKLREKIEAAVQKDT